MMQVISSFQLSCVTLLLAIVMYVQHAHMLITWGTES